MKPFYTPQGFRLSRCVAAGLFIVAFFMGYIDEWVTLISVLTLADWQVNL